MAEEVRDKKGRFGKGHKGGPGRPALKAYNRFRQMLLDSVDDDEFKAVVQVLVEQAKAGEAWAVKEFFDRMCGKSQQAVEELLDRTGEGGRSVGGQGVLRPDVREVSAGGRAHNAPGCREAVGGVLEERCRRDAGPGAL